MFVVPQEGTDRFYEQIDPGEYQSWQDILSAQALFTMNSGAYIWQSSAVKTILHGTRTIQSR